MLKKTVKIFLTLIFATVPSMALAAFDYGLDATVNATKDTLPRNVGGATDPAAIVGKILQGGLGLLGIAFFVLLFYAGLVWMTAMGKPERVQKAKDTMEAAIIGLVIVAASYAITMFLFKYFAA